MMTLSRIKRFGFGVSIMIASILLFADGSLHAGDSVKQRMAARAPQIIELKGNGVIGENNQGYLELRGGSDSAAAELVKAENKDRRAVYQAIAKKAGGTVEQVGQQVAAKRAKQAGKGEWLQKPGGEWYQK
jgi:uncharacterized protein YdbL (DUF1318 family)